MVEMVDDEIQGCGLMMRCEWHGTKGLSFHYVGVCGNGQRAWWIMSGKDFYVEYDTDKRAERRMVWLI